MPDGLNDLDQRRARRTRPAIPPSRHGPLPAPAPRPVAPMPSSPSTTTVERAVSPPAMDTPPVQAPSVRPAPPSRPRRIGGPILDVSRSSRHPVRTEPAGVRLVVYVDPDQAAWLQDQQDRARRAGERVTISTLVREAVRQLQERNP